MSVLEGVVRVEMVSFRLKYIRGYC